MRSLLLIMLAVGLTATVEGQSLSERIEQVRHKRQQQAAAAATAQRSATPTTRQKLAVVIDEITLSDATLREALEWWSRASGIDLSINWEAMLLAGVDPQQRVSVHLRHVSAAQVLAILLRRAAGPDVRLMYEATPWDIEILTRQQANRRTVLRTYDVRDLLQEIPSFTNAPQFDLQTALQQGTSGGGSGSRGGAAGSGRTTLFSDESDNEQEELTQAQRGEQLAQLIRDSIEPDIWIANGGAFSSIRYFNGMLIVRAPLYVHRQIGLPRRSVAAVSSAGGSTVNATAGTSAAAPRYVTFSGSTGATRTELRTTNAVRQRLVGRTVRAVGVVERDR